MSVSAPKVAPITPRSPVFPPITEQLRDAVAAWNDAIRRRDGLDDALGRTRKAIKDARSELDSLEADEARAMSDLGMAQSRQESVEDARAEVDELRGKQEALTKRIAGLTADQAGLVRARAQWDQEITPIQRDYHRERHAFMSVGKAWNDAKNKPKVQRHMGEYMLYARLFGDVPSFRKDGRWFVQTFCENWVVEGQQTKELAAELERYITESDR